MGHRPMGGSLSGAHGQAGQVCAELEANPAGVSLGQGLTALVGWHGVLSRVGKPQESCRDSQVGGGFQAHDKHNTPCVQREKNPLIY